MDEKEVEKLAGIIALKLKGFSFKELQAGSGIDGIPFARLWKRKTWNTNRAVALVPMTREETNAGAYAKSIKMILGRKLGYFLFFYPLGLQIIVYGQDILMDAQELFKYVDKIDTQTVVLQSIFLIDVQKNGLSEARTWGQYVTGKFQDAIHEAANQYLEERKQRIDTIHS